MKELGVRRTKGKRGGDSDGEDVESMHIMGINSGCTMETPKDRREEGEG